MTLTEKKQRKTTALNKSGSAKMKALNCSSLEKENNKTI
jgi:hypothetical protein